MTRRVRTRNGFALIAAVWFMITLAGLGLEVAVLARTRRLAAANAVESAGARAAAEAGIEHARARLTHRLTGAPTNGGANEPASADAWWNVALALTDTVVLGNARYTVRVSDVGARLNLNLASEDQLRALFAALRIDAGVADQVAECVADWRDADDLPRLHGAERAEYLRAGLRAMPRNAPLVRVEELRDVFGVTPKVYAAVAPHLTVRGSGQINLNSAPRPVLLALPGFTEEVVGVVLNLRAGSVAIASLDQLEAALPQSLRNRIVDATAALLPLVAFETREAEVVSEGWIAGSPVRVHVSGLFVRGGGAVFLQQKRTE